MESVFKNIASPRENTITFQVSPTHVAYANTLRRLCMTYVESVGFRADILDNGSTTDVKVLANSTPMTNEMLAHRIGLIPLHVTNPLQWDSEKYSFVLQVENNTEDLLDVFASDFNVLEKMEDGSTRQVPTSQFFKVHPVTQDTCLIATLKPLMPGGKAEELRIQAKATIGTGRENARFIPTAQCAYSYTKNTDPVAQKRAFDDWVCRSKMLDPAALDQDPERKAPLVREFNTLEINRCYLKDEGGEPYSFDFTIESAGVLHPYYIVQRACEKGAELCRQYTSAQLPKDVNVQRVQGRLVGFDFFFQRQDHTLGHLIQAWIDANLMGKGEVTFVGYDIPHPLRDEMVIRIGVSDGDETTATRALTTAMTACMAMFDTWKNQWAALVGTGPGGEVRESRPVTRRVIKRPGAAPTT